ncbi:hypothetical protein [Ehrlichia muris]|uniref:Uncharacterized protein n=2 Tax=Ehrlichia muris TaxID=35795 RepID=V9R902_9RICK|nr:hypothetical protein [Ehrlichia muris]ABD93646.1 unknown [Ehrlichia muris AS145]AHC39768.1 hypothetical protein EMUR_04590 [Ehrlichia muris AS145]
MIHKEKFITVRYVLILLLFVFYIYIFLMLVSMSSSIKNFIIHTIGFYKVNIFNANTKKLTNAEDVIVSFNNTKLSIGSKSLTFHQRLQVFYRVFLCIKGPYGIIDALYMILIYQYKLEIDSSHLINQYNKNTLVITSIPSIRGFGDRARVRNILNNKESSYE